MANATENQMTEDMELQGRQVRSVYLLTYSQADLSVVPDRGAFAEKVVESFRHVGADINQWACSMEQHQEGGWHFHMVVKLAALHRWLAVKNYLNRNYGIVCHFSNRHSNYYTAWKYVTKEDITYIQSAEHPDLVNPTDRRQTVDDSNRGAADTSESGRKRRKKRLTAYEVSKIIISNGIQTRTELLAFANAQELLGKTDVAEFIVNRGAKCVAETLEVRSSCYGVELGGDVGNRKPG